MGSAKQFLVVPTRPRFATYEMVAVPIRCFGKSNRVLGVKPSGRFSATVHGSLEVVVWLKAVTGNRDI